MELMTDQGILSMLAGATTVVKIVLGLLVAMSLWSWAIIFHKLLSLGRAKRNVVRGYETFTQADDLSSALQAVSRDTGSPLTRIGTGAVREFRKLEKADIERERKRHLVKDTLKRILRQNINAEMKKLSANISFLATCANAAPFIGLFGTVWGIMHSFHSIGLQQTAALAVVAPGISEALVATAIGLGVAIPATIAYNFFLSVLGGIQTDMVNFAGAFLNRVEREVSWVTGKKSTE